MLKNILKRTLSTMLVIMLVATTFFIFDPSVLMTASASVSKTDPSYGDNLFFVVPEAIYLKPNASAYTGSTSSAFQFYIDQTLSGSTISNRTGENQTGNLYFYYAKATGNVTLSFAWQSTPGTALSGSQTISIKNSSGTTALSPGGSYTTTSSTTALTITAGTSPSLGSTTKGCYIEWTATYTDSVDGLSKKAYAYTYVYKPYIYPVGVAQRTCNDRGAASYCSSFSWLVGVHGSQTARDKYPNNNFYTIANSYNSGTSVGTGGETLYAQLASNWGHGNDTGSGGWVGGSTSTAPDATCHYNNCSPSAHTEGDDEFLNFTYSGTGLITVDTSRYSNYNKIPNVTCGIEITDHEGVSDNNSAAYFISNVTASKYSADKSDYWATSDGTTDAYWNAYYNGTRFSTTGNYGTWSGSAKCGTKICVRWNKSVTSGVNYLGYGVANHDSGDRCCNVAEIRCQVNTWDKSTLRSAYQNAMKAQAKIASNNVKSDYWNRFIALYRFVARELCKVPDTYSTPGTITKYNGSTQSNATEAQLTAALNDAVTNISTMSSTYRDTYTATQNNLKVYDSSGWKLVSNTAKTASGWFKGAKITFGTESYNGYTYKGYRTAESNISTANSATTGQSNNMTSGNYTVNNATGATTVYYYYLRNNYTVTFDVNNGASVSNITYHVESTTTLPSTTRNGYTFANWKVTSSTDGSWTNGATVSSGTSLSGKYGNVTLQAQWTAQSYTVTYDAKGGNSKTALGYKITDTSALGSTTRTGYNFTGWKPNAASGNWSASTTYSSTDTVQGKYGNVTLNAQWSAIGYTITYNADGGTMPSGVSSPRSYNIESTGTLGAPTKNGYNFGGWVVSTAAGNWSATTYAADTSLNGKYGSVSMTASWSKQTYTITYDGKDGTPSVASQTYTVTDTISLATASRTGYTFNNWKPNAASGNWSTSSTYAGSASGMYGNVTLNAQWYATGYTISFSMNGGDGATPPDISYNITQAVTLPTATRTAYSFVNWKPHSAAGNWSTSSTYSGTLSKGMYGNVTLDAQWSPVTYYITYNATGGSLPSGVSSPRSYNTTSNATLGTPTWNGYTFSNWEVVSSAGNWAGQGNTYAANQSLNGKYGDVSIKANWSANSYTITYNANGGAAKTALSYKITDSKTLGDTTRTGYTFSNWVVETTGGNWGTAGSQTYTSGTNVQGKYGDVKLKAQWTANKFTMTFNENNGTWNGWNSDGTNASAYADTKAKKIQYDSTYGAAIESNKKWPVAPTRSGYTFFGWTSDGTSTGTVYASGDTVTVTDNLTVKAAWTINSYTLTIKPNSGTWNNSGNDTTITKNYGETYTVSGTPTRTGYSFTGWTKGGTGTWDASTGKFTFGAGNGTLTAGWSLVNYNLTYNLAGGTPNATANPSTYNVTTDAFTLKNPTMTGHTFAGWTGGGLGSATVTVTINSASGTFPKGSTTGDKTFTATWTADTYTLTFNPGGGSVTAGGGFTAFSGSTTASKNITFGQTYGTSAGGKTWPNNPTKNGYDFAGWAKDGTVYGQNDNVSVTASLTVTATWNAHKYTIGYTLNSGALPSGQTNPTEYYITSAAITLKNPVRDYYNFKGWGGTGLTGQENTSVTIASGSTGNRSYTAYWTPITYTIGYDLKGGTANATANPTTYNVESSPITLNNPSRNGYTFAGWTGGGLSSATVTVTIPTGSHGNRTYTATWNTVNYTVTYDANYGTAKAALTYNTTQSTALGDTSRNGYTFNGWVPTSNGGNWTASSYASTDTVNGKYGDVTLQAQWSATKYTISYNLDGGSVTSNPTEYYITSSAITLNNPTKTGYTFKGWSGTGLTGDTNKSVTIAAGSTGNRSYTANWTLDSYTINYTLSYGEGSVTNPTSYNVTTATFTLNNPSANGWTFTGWTGSNGSSPQTTVTIAKGTTGNKNYTANWSHIQYTITFDGNPVAYANKTYYIDSTNITLGKPSRNGYTFNGWKVETAAGNWAAGTYQDTQSVQGKYGNVSMKAQWTATEYTIGYTLAGGTVSGTNPTKYTIESAAITLINPTRTGYSFLGWTGTGLEGATTSVTIPTGSTGNRSFTATWSLVTYTIGYDLKGGSLGDGVTNPTSYNVTTATITLNNPTKTGYTFTGWTGSNGTTAQTSVTIPKGSTGNKNYTANWGAITYTVTLNKQGGSGGNASVQATFGSDMPSAGTKPSKGGYTFGGYYRQTGGNGTQYYNANNASAHVWDVAGDTTIYAKWTATNYTIIFNLNGSGASLDVNNPSDYLNEDSGNYEMSYNIESTKNLLPAKRNGYTHTGWKLAEDVPGNWEYGTTYNKTLSVTGFYGDVELKAQWSAIEYTITFQMPSGSATSPAYTNNQMKYKINSASTVKLPNATMTGYTLSWWYTETNTGSWVTTGHYSSGTALAGKYGDVTLKPKFTAQTFTLTFDPKGGSVAAGGGFTAFSGTTTASKTVTYDKTYGTANNSKTWPTEPTKDGYSFGGWKIKNSTTIIHDYDTVAITADTTVEAQWNVESYSIGYTLNGGALAEGEENPTSYKITDADITLINPTRNGYDFAGWTGTGLSAATTTVTIPTGSFGDRSYAANWTAKVYQISYNANNGTLPTGSNANPTTYTITTATFTLKYPSRAGYNFAGWTGTGLSAATMDVVIAKGSTGNRSYTATWSAQEYTVTLNRMAGTDTSVTGDTSVTATYDAAMPAAIMPTRTGYTFGGYFTETGGGGTKYYNANGTSARNWDKTSNTTLYAYWTTTTYHITYVLNGGSLGEGVTNPGEFTIETAKFTLNNPSKTGYTFAGWTGTGLSGATVTVEITKGSTGDRTYTATYTPDTYQITYNYEGGALASGQTNPSNYTIESNITLKKPAKDGYTFAGWTGTGLSAATIDVTFGPGEMGPRSYFATWTPKPYTISFNADGGTALDPKTYNPDQTTAIGATTRTGYTFTKWVVEITGGNWGAVGTEYLSTATVAGKWGNVALKAIWTIAQFDLKVDPNGGTFAGILGVTTYTGDYQSTRQVGPASRVGYDFTGWTLTGAGSYAANSTASTGGTYTYGADEGRLTAGWSAIKYTITYNYGVGEGSVTNPAEYYITTETFTLNNPSKTGWTFNGWTGTDLSVATSEVTITKGSIGNRTYLANWTRNDYTVTLNKQGGSGGPATVTATYGSAMPTSGVAMPTKTGYDFKGYFASAGGQGTKYYNANGSSANNWDQTDNSTIYAYWTPMTFTLTFNPNGGTIPSGNGFSQSTGTQDKTITYNSTYGATAGGKSWPKDPVRTGHTFNGWKNGNTTIGKDDSVSIVPEGGTIIVTADWIKQTYTLVYNKNGVEATMPASQTLEYDTASAYAAAPTPTDSTWTFRGWSTDKNTTSGTVAAGESTITSTVVNSWFGESGVGAGGTKNVYAIWVKTLTGTFTDTTGNQTASVNIYNGATKGTITAPSQRVYNGWTAKGWTTGTTSDAAASTAETYEISANTQYYGRYDRTVKVTYHPEGGSSTPSATSVTQKMNAKTKTTWTNPKATLAGAITRDGYSFAGWKIGSTTYGASAQYTIEANVDAYAQWTLYTFTVTIDPNGGTISNVDYYATGATSGDVVSSGEIADVTNLTMVHTTMATIALPERDGYTFHAWTIDPAPADGVLVTSTSAESTYKVGASNVTLTVDWTPKTYTLIFSSNRGDGVNIVSDSYDYNEEVTLPGDEIFDDPYTGYTFLGWNCNVDGMPYGAGDTYIQEQDGIPFTETVPMVADWTASQYHIAYSLNGYTIDDLTLAGETEGWDWYDEDPDGMVLTMESGDYVHLLGAFSDAAWGEGDYYYVNTADEVRFGLGWSYNEGETSADDLVPFATDLMIDDIPSQVLDNAEEIGDGEYVITLYMVWSANYRPLENAVSAFQQTYMTFDDGATLLRNDYNNECFGAPIYTDTPASAMLPAIAAVDADYKANGARAREIVPNTSDPAHGKYDWVAAGLTDIDLTDWDSVSAEDANDFTTASLDQVNGKLKAIFSQVIFDPCNQFTSDLILPQTTANQNALTTSVNRLNEAMNATNIANGTGYILSALRLKDVDLDYRVSDDEMAACDADYSGYDFGEICETAAEGGISYRVDEDTKSILENTFGETIESMYPPCESVEREDGEIGHHSFNELLDASDVLGKVNAIFEQFGFDPTQPRDDSADYFTSGNVDGNGYTINDDCPYTTQSVARLFDLIYGQPGNNGLYTSMIDNGLNGEVDVALYYQVKDILGSGATVLLKKPSQEKLNKIVTLMAYGYHSLEMKDASYTEFINLFQNYFDATWGTKLRAAGYASSNQLSTYEGYFTAESYQALSDWLDDYFYDGALWPNGDGARDANGKRHSFPYYKGVEQNMINGKDPADGSVRTYSNGWIDESELEEGVLDQFNYAEGTLCSDLCYMIDALEPATADYSEVFRLIARNVKRQVTIQQNTNTFYMVDNRGRTDEQVAAFYPSTATEIGVGNNYKTWYDYYADPAIYGDRDAWAAATYTVKQNGADVEKPAYDVDWLYRFYTEDTVEGLLGVLAGIDWEKNKLQQSEVDGKTGTNYSSDTICYELKAAIDNLKPKKFQVDFYRNVIRDEYGNLDLDHDYLDKADTYRLNGRDWPYYFGMTVEATKTPDANNELGKTFYGWYTMQEDDTHRVSSASNVFRTNLVLDEHLIEEWCEEDGSAEVYTNDGELFIVNVYARYVENVTLDIDMDGGSGYYDALIRKNDTTSSVVDDMPVYLNRNDHPTYNYGSTLTFSEPTKQGYRFVRWEFEQGENNTASAFDSATGVYTFGYSGLPKTNDTLTAIWEANTYTVTFHKNHADATGTMAPQTLTYDTEATLTPNAFTRTGFRFLKWTQNADGTGREYTDEQSVLNLTKTQGANIDLYAQWEYADFNLTFHAAYREPSEAWYDGTKATFVGKAWDGTSAFGEGLTKTITFGEAYGKEDADGKTWPVDPKVTYEITDDVIVTVTFLGWYTDVVGGTGPITAESTVGVTADQDLYPHFNFEYTKIVKDKIEIAIDFKDANKYTMESMQAVDDILIRILDTPDYEPTAKDLEDLEAAIAALVPADDKAVDGDVTPPTVSVYENKEALRAAIASGEFTGDASYMLRDDVGEISYVMPGKCYYTYYCYTNSATPAIMINAKDVMGANNRLSYPTTVTPVKKSQSGVVNSGWMNYTFDPEENNSSGRTAGYDILERKLENPYRKTSEEDGLKYFGMNYSEGIYAGDTGYDYYTHEEYVMLKPVFVENGGKQFALYTFAVSDDAYNTNAAVRATLAGAEGFGDYATEGANLTETANTDITPVNTVTIFVEYNNTMNGDRADAAGQVVDENGVGTYAGTGLEVYNNFHENGYKENVWTSVDYLYRNSGGIEVYEFIAPQKQEDGSYASYVANDPVYGQTDLGSFFYLMKSTDSATTTYWEVYDRYLAENPGEYHEARVAAASAALDLAKAQVIADMKDPTTREKMDARWPQGASVQNGDYLYWPYAETSTQWYTQFYAPARTREDTLVYVHIYDRWGNHYTNILQRDLQDTQAAQATQPARGEVIINELGGSEISNIQITELNTKKKVTVAGMTDDQTWNMSGNRFTIEGLPQGKDNYKYTMWITDDAGNEQSFNFQAREDGSVTVTVNDETMGGSYAAAAAAPLPQSQGSGATNGIGAPTEIEESALTTLSISEVQPDAITVNTIEEAQITQASPEDDRPDTYTFTVNEVYTVNLFAGVYRDYEVTLKCTTGGTLKAYVNGEAASPKSGKITVPAGSQVQISAAPKAGYELESLTMVYPNGRTVELTGAYNAEINDDVTIKAVFVETATLLTITVENGAVSGKQELLVSPYSRVTAVAEAAPEGKVFAFWAQNGEDDIPVSYDEIYTFIATSDVSLKAIYADAPTTQAASIVMDTTNEAAHITVVNGAYTLSYSGKITLPEGAQIEEFGMVLTNQSADNCTDENFVIGGTVNGVNVVKVAGQSLNEEGQCMINVNNVKPGQTRTGRLYLTVRYADGTTETIYSSTWSELNTPAA